MAKKWDHLLKLHVPSLQALAECVELRGLIISDCVYRNTAAGTENVKEGPLSNLLSDLDIKMPL